MKTAGQHVVPKGGRWVVRKAGAARATRVFKTQKEAIDAAIALAKEQRTQLYIHGKDGRIRERNSYDTTSPPQPIKG